MNVGYLMTMYKKKISGRKEEITDEIKANVLLDIIKPVKYIPFATKQKCVVDIIKKTVFENNGKIVGNSTERYLEFINILLYEYYNLDIQENTYDELSSVGLLQIMVALIKDEYDMFRTILDSYMSDLESGRLSLESL